MDEISIQQAARDAILVQDACNLSGVVYSFARAVKAVRAEASRLSEGTGWVNSHPIVVMYSSKIASLTSCENTEVFAKAYAECQRLSNQ